MISDSNLDLRDIIGRTLMALAALAALLALVLGIAEWSAVSEDRQWIELWRTLGYGVFVGMYLLLALRPRRSAGIWELSFLHKALLGLAAFAFLPNLPEAVEAGPVDAGLAVVTAIAYWLTRGWRSWRG